MKKTIITTLFICLLLPSAAFAKGAGIKADTPIPERFRSLFDTCGVNNEEELFDLTINYLRIALGSEAAEQQISICQNDPVKVRYGATTKDLISNKKWDLAIVSSKDVDLQALADKELINADDFGARDSAYRQCLLPEALASILPNKNDHYAYYVYCFDYDAQNDDATLLIAKYPSMIGYWTLEAIVDARPAEMVRNVEGINRVKYWTIDQLIEKQVDWDTAVLDVHVPDETLPEELKRLDEAGLLYDLSQNNYLASRTDIAFEKNRNYNTMPRGLFSEDGRMVAVPYRPFRTNETDNEQHVFFVNAKSVYVEKALAYGELLLKITETTYINRQKLTLEEARGW